MKIIKCNFIVPKGFVAIMICGVLFVRKDIVLTDSLITHETIHYKLMMELLIIGFYLIYLIEWCIKSIKANKSLYRYISFELEAYNNQHNKLYLLNRKRYSWFKHF